VLHCPLSDPGFLYPGIAVAAALRDRGHDVWTMAAGPAAAPLAAAGVRHLPAGLYGDERAFMVAAWFRELPEQYRAIRRAAREVRPDVLVTSVLCHGALLAAEALDLPVVVLGLAAHLWGYAAGAGGEAKHATLRSWRTNDMLRLYNEGRERAGFAARLPDATGRAFIGSALLLRGDPELEFPGARLPEGVHHVGPCAWEPPADPAEVQEVFDLLDRVDKPLVYVHLGRRFGATSPWPRLNAAFTGGRFQALVELGRSERPRPASDADLLVVRKPWMGPFVERAGLVLSNGTSASVLHALLRGRPLGLSPAGSEQPLLTEACIRAGVGVPVPNDPGPTAGDRLDRAWRDTGLHARARRMGRRLAAMDGPARAADVIGAVVAGTRVGVAD
jgi:UDP:flavonoid glycosyltransferase YjiC (YdhE family)